MVTTYLLKILHNLLAYIPLEIDLTVNCIN